MGVSRAVFSGTSPSPGTGAADKNRPLVCQNTKTDSRFSCNSPQMPESINSSRFPMMGSSPGLPNNFMQQQPQQPQQQPCKPGPHFPDISPNGKSNCGVGNNDGSIKDPGSGNYQCVGPDNVPLNPNGVTRMGMGVGNGVKPSFDPITSLAQMSQQLTTNVAGSPGSQPGNMMHPGVMPFNNPAGNMHLMQMNDMGVCQDGIRMGNPQMTSHPHSFSPGSNGSGRMIPCPGNNNSVSPKPGLMQTGPTYPGPMGPRMMSRPPVSNSYNGANIQVKPSAPNTIQYLPTRAQAGQTAGPRAPPSLDFLQRFSNPLSNLDAKVPTHNLQYFPNNYQQNNSVNTSDMNMLGSMNCGGMNQGIGMIRGAVRGGSGGMLRGMPQVGFGGGDGMFPGAGSGPGPGNCQMFVPGGKGSPGMGMGVPPDASQPLPPSMGQSNSFKNSSFIGPTTSDPNYAQQFHNFQQQLYATNTRSQMSNQTMGTNQQFFVPK